MKADLSFSQFSSALTKFLHRYHVILFALVVLGGLTVATFMLYSVITATPDEDISSTASSFDKQTIEKIESLRSTNEQSEPLNLPAGRTNPFQ